MTKTTSTRVPLTPEILAELRFLREATGVGPQKLLRGPRPRGLQAAAIYNWLSGKSTTAEATWLAFVQAKWRDLLLNNHAMVAITDELRAELRFHRERTGLSAARLLRVYPEIAEGLTGRQVGLWLSGRVKHAQRDRLEAVAQAWRTHGDPASTPPSKPEGDMVPITTEIFAKLDGYRQAGFLPGVLFRTTTDMPHGLTRGMVGGWLNGGTQVALSAFLEFVLTRCEAMARDPKRRVAITERMLSRLAAERERTGCGPKDIVSGLTTKRQAQLSHWMITSWCNRQVKTVQLDHWGAVMRYLTSQPDRPQ